MPNVRTTCPTCDVVVVDAPSLTVRLHAASGDSEAMFVCPGCGHDVVHQVDDHMIPVLIGAGCPVAADDDEVGYPGSEFGLDPAGPGSAGWHPAFGPEISAVEIARFVDDLDRFDWFDELAH